MTKTDSVSAICIQDAPNRSGDLFLPDRFLAKLPNAGSFNRGFVGKLTVSGTEDNRQILSRLQDLPRELQPGEIGHGLIGDDEVEGGGVCSEMAERLGAVAEGGDVIS